MRVKGGMNFSEPLTGASVWGPFAELLGHNMHETIYRLRPEVKAIIHFYGDYTAGEPLISEKGTQELVDQVVNALADEKTVYLQEHGNVWVGDSLKELRKRLRVKYEIKK
jgi:ribulose-5-phosphate 4-epimerase/fuculose-1-phosphate aldolase